MAPHLQRRNGVFHLRVRVPDRLKVRVGMLEVRRSLHVYSLAQARPLALRYAARVMEVFELAQSDTLSTADIKRMMVGCFVGLASDVEGFVPSSEFPDMERAEQACLVEERIRILLDQIAEAKFDDALQHLAFQLVEREGRSFDALTKHAQIAVCEGVARAQVEALRYSKFRIGERLLRYQVQDAFPSSPSPLEKQCELYSFGDPCPHAPIARFRSDCRGSGGKLSQRKEKELGS